MKIILLTVLISFIAALLFPRPADTQEAPANEGTEASHE
jgi:hypothetical protein